MSAVIVLPHKDFIPSLTPFIAILKRLKIRFHLTGGISAVAYGEPRMTQDVDFVLDPEQVRAVEDQFLNLIQDAGFYFNESTAKHAIESGKMFQILDIEQVLKLDIYVRCLIDGELDQSIQVELSPGFKVPMVSRVDAALSKLIWIQNGSHRSRRDLRQILAAADELENTTMHRMAKEMNLEGLLDEVLGEQDEIDI